MVENKIPVQNGKATYRIPSTMAQGIYQIHAKYSDDDLENNGTRHYAPSETDNTLTITKNAINGTINENNEIVTKWFQPYTYRAHFTQKGIPVEGGTVKFSLGNDKEGNEIVLGTAVTDENGDAFLYNVQLNPAEVPSIEHDSYNTVPLFVTLQNAVTYNTTPLTTQIKIEKRELDLSLVTSSSISQDEYVTISGSVYDKLDTEEKDRIDNIPLKISLQSNLLGTAYTEATINGVSYSFTDNTKRLPGEYTAYVRFEGNKIYSPKEVSSKIYVKENYTITTYPGHGLDKTQTEVAATVRNSQGQTVSGVLGQCIIYDDDTGKALFTSDIKGTNSKGNYNFKYTPSAGSSLTQTITWIISGNQTREQTTATETFIHQRKTNITYQSNPTTLQYGKEGTWTAYINDSANKPVPNTPCNAYITKAGTTTRTQINTAELKTDRTGKVTFKYKYNKTMEGGHYTITILNEDTDHYEHFLGNNSLGKPIDLKLVNNPVIELTDIVCEESYDSTKSAFGTKGEYTNTTKQATFTATIYRNKKEDGPFPNLNIDGLILNYEINGRTYTYDLRGDGTNKTPVVTNAEGVATLTVPIPCAKFAINNICSWQINANTDSGEFHTSTTKNQNVKIKRHIYMEIPPQELNLTSNQNVVTIQAMDSHGDDINKIYIRLSGTSKRGGAAIIADNQTSLQNTVTITNVSLPYTTVSMDPQPYYINTWSTNTTDYINDNTKFFSSTTDDVYVSVNPTITIEVNPEYTSNTNNWQVPANTELLATKKIGFRLTATYPKYNAGAGVVQKPVKNLQYTYLFEGTDIGGGTTNSNGQHIKATWEVPETTAYKNKLKAVITPNKFYPVQENPQTVLKIKKTVLFYSTYNDLSMGPNGKMFFNGQFVTINGKPVPNVTYNVKLSNSNDTRGNTIYDTDGSVFQLKTDANGKVEKVWDNTTSNPYRTTSLTNYNGKTIYFHFVSQDNGSSDEAPVKFVGGTDVYGGLPVAVGEGYTVLVYGGTFRPDNIHLKARVLGHTGKPLEGIQVSIDWTGLSHGGLNIYHLTTDENGFVEEVRDYTNVDWGTSSVTLGRITTFRVTTGNQTIDGVTYGSLTASTKIVISRTNYCYVPQNTTVSTTQYGSIPLKAVVYNDDTKQTVSANQTGFKIEDVYSGITLPGEYSTDDNGMLSATINTNQNAKWYTWKYRFIHQKTDLETYSASPTITVQNRHAITGEATPVTCTYNETIFHPLIIRIADKSYTRGTQAGIKGTYSYEDNGQPKTDTYNMVGMGYALFIDSKNNGNEADFVSLMGGNTLTMQEDGILGTTNQRSWKNLELSTKGTFNLVLKPVLNSWTTDQKNKYVQTNITLPNAITIQ